MWKVTLGLALLAAVNLAAHAGVVIAMRSYVPGNLPTSYQILLHTCAILNYVQFGVALFCLGFGRFKTPWPQLWCSVWVAAAAMLDRLQPGLRHPDIAWNLLFVVTSLWTGYAIFILGRWHFGTEFARGAAETSKRKWVLTPAALATWGAILIPVIAGNLLLNLVPRPDAIENPWPIWATPILYAVVLAMLQFPLLAAMLTRRWTWVLVTVPVSLFVIWAMIDVIPLALVNPPFALERVIDHSITLAVVVTNAFVLRLIGLRWLDAEPWPAPVRTAMQTTPDPFA